MANKLLESHNKINNWSTNTAYQVGDVVIKDGYAVYCNTAHTSTTFSTNVNSGNWKMAYPMKNLVINGGMLVNQRQNTAALTGSQVYYLDRFSLVKTGAASVTVAQDTDVPSGGRSSKSLKFSWTSSAHDWVVMRYKFEAADIAPYIGKTVTLKFKLKLSTLSGFQGITVFDTAPSASNDWTTSTGITGGTTLRSVASGSITAGQYFDYVVTWTVPSTVGPYSTANGYGLEFFFDWDNSTVVSPNVWITEMTVNEGPAPADFQTAGANIQQELAMCQRYYEKGAGYSGLMMLPGLSVTNNNLIHSNRFLIEKRIAPNSSQLTFYSFSGTAGRVSNYDTGTEVATNNIVVFGNASVKNFNIINSSGGTVTVPATAYGFGYTCDVEL